MKDLRAGDNRRYVKQTDEKGKVTYLTERLRRHVEEDNLVWYERQHLWSPERKDARVFEGFNENILLREIADRAEGGVTGRLTYVRLKRPSLFSTTSADVSESDDGLDVPDPVDPNDLGIHGTWRLVDVKVAVLPLSPSISTQRFFWTWQRERA